MRFQLIDFKSNNITENLDFDDKKLIELNKYPQNYLRFWEVSHYAVILGKSNSAQKEVNLSNCSTDIPIIKRCSGGGTVLLGPGCLCYSLFIETKKPFHSITTTNSNVMSKNCQALKKINPNISVKGFTDLCIGNRKFSGNAQRRMKNITLFHGTFLYNFDLTQISKTLHHPTKEPDYRIKRKHRDFITNVNMKSSTIKKLITDEWINTF
mgnify:CR=1 FL=1